MTAFLVVLFRSIVIDSRDDSDILFVLKRKKGRAIPSV